MRPEHAPEGDPCLHVYETDGRLCGRSARAHRTRKRLGRPDYHRRVPAALERIVAVDGEGQGRAPHRYTYLAAVDESGELYEAVRNADGLTTKQCLDFFLNLREMHDVKRVFGFAIGYDLTKILADLPDQKLYVLNRPELRQGKKGHRSVFWKGYRLNYLRGRLAVQKVVWDPINKRSAKKGASIVIWDVFRFFATKFTSALIDWGIAPQEKLEFMASMKEQRARFDQLQQAEIERYCGEECQYLAKLVRELIEAHETVGLRLQSFYGAGSTASALLSKIGVLKHMAPPPEEMRDAVSRAFFGGRFEVSKIGPVEGPVFNYDISSAYPYQTTFLPCLACGRWERVQGRRVRARLERARLGVVRAVPRRVDRAPKAWGPLPWRSDDGTILFPQASGGVWVWRDEALAAERLFPQVQLKEAWVYETQCDHQPFREIPSLYAERLRIGKDGRGLVIKLGVNSVYGKLAQSVGTAKFNSWVYAGSITSGTRAQLLSCFDSVRDWWDVLMFATDGVWSRVPLDLPKPRETNTSETGKPLGGWERKDLTRGVFLLRPGIYFPLNPTQDDIKEVRARGISKAVLLEAANEIVDHWRVKGWREPYRVAKYQRFVGMKSGVHAGPGGKPVRSDAYGEWIDFPIEASFDPNPKRRRVLPDHRLEMWDYEREPSCPYVKAIASKSPEALSLKFAEMTGLEQPDGDIVEV